MNKRIPPISQDPEVYRSNYTTPRPYIRQRGAERKLLALMALGNPELFASHLEDIIGKVSEQAVDSLSEVPLPQAKYKGITLAAAAYRIAVQNGVPKAEADAIHNKYQAKYDRMEDSGTQWEIARELLREFCSAISDAGLCMFTPAVRQCCEYIHTQLHSNVSLDELGEVCHLSPHYVSDLFRKEMGVGALQYAHQVKMQYAKFLLEHTDLGIAEISALLSYPSHSNFSQRFRRTYGVTPHEFRVAFGK